MNRPSSWMGGSLLAALVFGLIVVPEADARGGRGGGGHSGGGHSGGGHARAPRVSAAQRAYKAPTFKAPKMPHAAAPARASAVRGQTRTNTAMARANHAQATTNSARTRANVAGTTGSGTTSTTGTRSTTPGSTAGTRSTTAGSTTGTRSTTSSPYGYTYGSGGNARQYRAYGYGRGYRNRYNGRSAGYGRSQGNNRAVIARLRSTHSTLARLDADYRGHRVRAMHSVSMAIRQLSHRSMVYGNTGFANGLNNNMAMGRRPGGRNGNAGRRNPNQRIPQAQSDARMSQALRNLQGVNMQLSSQGSNTSSHARARGHVQHAMRELNTALSIR